MAQEDEYFPSFLTAIQSTTKADKSTEGAPHSRVEADLLSLKSKQRLTFAESLDMNRSKQKGVTIPGNSPFSLGGSYQDGLGTRRRKCRSSQGAATSNGSRDKEVPPPPTISMLDPVELPCGVNAEASAAYAISKAAAAKASHYPTFHSDEWGQDKQYWVTVFGFPPTARSLIRRHFQRLGEVITLSSTTSGGNWLHIRYLTRLQAEKAISCDGTTLTNGIMVGVKKCYPSDRDANALDEGPVSDYFDAHLRQNLGSSELEVEPTDADILLPPKRQRDICSRLLSYLFNW